MDDIEMQPITTERKTSSLSREENLNKQVEELKGTMNDNVTKVLENIDITNDLEQQTEEMKGLSRQFSMRSKQIKRKMWYKNARLNIICLFLLAGVIYYIYDSVI